MLNQIFFLSLITFYWRENRSASSILKVATDRHPRLVRNKSATASLLIITACLDPPWQVLRSTKIIVPTAVSWHCCEPASVDLSTLSKPCQNSFKASRSIKACYEIWGWPNSQGLLRAALEVCYESIWGLKVEAILDLYEPALSVDLWLPLVDLKATMGGLESSNANTNGGVCTWHLCLVFVLGLGRASSKLRLWLFVGDRVIRDEVPEHMRELRQGSQQFPRIKFHDFSMILSCFFHDQRNTKMMVSGISFYFSYCGLHIIPFSHTYSTKYETNNTNFIIIIGICQRSAKSFGWRPCSSEKNSMIFP